MVKSLYISPWLLFIKLVAATFLITAHEEVNSLKANTFELSKDELEALPEKTSSLQLSTDQLYKWDRVYSELFQKKPPEEGGQSRLVAYLYTAQKAFADAAHQLSGSYLGSFDPVSFHIVHLFYPDFRRQDVPSFISDTFTDDLTQLLAEKIDARFNNEQEHIRPVKAPADENMWRGEHPYLGQTIPSMQPWRLERPDQFRVAPPPKGSDPFWKEELEKVNQSVQQRTPKEQERILFWAGKTGIGSGDWVFIANKYMEEHKTSLEKQLKVRATLATALFDSVIAVFDSKYAYMVKRPNMLNPNLKLVIPTPNHPSFPSAHSTASQVAAMILDAYFPENKNEWNKLAEEAGMSRIWGGIHFFTDHAIGKALGKQVGNLYVNK